MKGELAKLLCRVCTAQTLAICGLIHEVQCHPMVHLNVA